MEIPRVNSHRFLGVILDHKLNGKSHFKHLINKGQNIININMALSGIKWGAHPGLLLTIYRSVLRSSIEYGCQFFSWSIQSSEFTKLLRIQYKAIRKAMGYRISTPINVMLSEAREPPLHHRFTLSISKYIYKAMAHKFSPAYLALKQMDLVATSKNLKIQAIQDSFQFRNLFKAYVLSRHVKKTIHRSAYPTAFWHKLEVISSEINYIRDMLECDTNNPPEFIAPQFLHKSLDYRLNAITIYTDGSKEPGNPVGAGVYLSDLGISIAHKLPAQTSIFSAELWAIYQATLLARDCGHNNTTIFSDSKNALDAISNNKYFQRNYIIYYIKQSILNASKEGTNIALFWIPSHSGITGNETIDSIAKDAAINGTIPEFRIPHEDLFYESNNKASAQFKDYLKTAASFKGVLHFARYQLLRIPGLRTLLLIEKKLSRLTG
ncbi:PREDICTED: uncharacterized protein LOC108759173 [Trachymyrmex cornetzi]|uniref:uncharacterized protein LOC108759173 n=1 Tax=Trachymyrmex cornetzi TaxID=471704 RepID=UPI00084F2876|nr:PREDICTED: uncharacterized protein LOC108759173 [Trachymyrmex cornetzi]